MGLAFRKSTPRFAAEVSPIDLRRVHDEDTLAAIRAGMDEQATRPDLIYRHVWRAGDLVIRDNRATMRRATAFDDQVDRREPRRVTTLDIEQPALVTSGT